MQLIDSNLYSCVDHPYKSFQSACGEIFQDRDSESSFLSWLVQQCREGVLLPSFHMDFKDFALSFEFDRSLIESTFIDWKQAWVEKF